jgi:hypothetical protein
MHVRGYTIFDKRAGALIKSCAYFSDTCILLVTYLLTLSFFGVSPSLGWLSLGLFFSLALFYWYSQIFFFRITLGGRIWHLKATQRKNSTPTLLQKSYLNTLSIFISTLVTTLSLLTAGTLFREVVLKHPLWTPSEIWKMDPFIPQTSEWSVAPFFYTLGAWPKTFSNHPVYYSLPYEKGPPTRFIGHVFLDWSFPEIRVVIEGPKTPEKAGSQAELRECFLKNRSLRCLTQREETLKRHLSEIQKLSPKSWVVKWFHVNNPYLPPESQAQGIYLGAVGNHWAQDRFILVSSNHTQQTFVLQRALNADGEVAFDLMQKTLRSFRLFSELDSGKAWINRELENIRLEHLNSLSDEKQVTSTLAEIQGQLISKISVEPGSYDSYFHLAGTAGMLIKKLSTLSTAQKYSFKRNIQSASQYTSDIAPRDPRTTQIQDLLKDQH